MHEEVRIELSPALYTGLLAHVPLASRLAKFVACRTKNCYVFTGTESDALDLAGAVDVVAPEDLPRVLAALPRNGNGPPRRPVI
jgi:hypothetical protein